jgi:hypothetical protein
MKGAFYWYELIMQISWRMGCSNSSSHAKTFEALFLAA